MMYRQLRSYKSEEITSLTERMRLLDSFLHIYVATYTGYDGKKMNLRSGVGVGNRR